MTGPTNTLRVRDGGRRTVREAEVSVHPPRPPVPLALPLALPRPGRRELRELVARLVVEYGGVVAPGRVMAAVYRAHQLLRHQPVGTEAHLAACERLVRQRLGELPAARPQLRAV
jgi:hypothetical protein